MRIIYTCQLTSVAGGLERIMCEKASAMAQTGHDVCIITNNPPGCSHAYDIDGRVKVIDLQLSYPTGIWQRLWFKLRQNRRIYAEMRRFRPDITVAAPTWLTTAALLCPGRLVLESHSPQADAFSGEKHSAYKRLKTAFAERRASAVVALTKEDSQYWHSARRLEVIPNFSDMARHSNAKTRHGALAIGRLSPVKRFDVLIDAWALVVKRHPEARLDIYGEGELKDALIAQIMRLGLQNHVVLRGRSDEIHEVYSSHEFLIASSDYEGLPLMLIEAMQCGCPCISVDCPCGPREIITDGEDGMLIPFRGIPRNEVTEAIADAACRMIENPELRLAYGEKARANSARFSKDKIMRLWECLFKEIAQ